MPEENNNAAGLGLNPGAGENNSGAGADKPVALEPGQADAGDNDKKGGDGSQKVIEGDAKAPQGIDDNKDDGEEPAVRNQLTPKDYIIQRKQKKIEKLEGVDKDDGDGEGDDVLPEDEAIIDKVVSKRIAPLIRQTLDVADDSDIKGFLQENPEFKPFEAKARRWIKDPSRQHLPISTVFYEAAGYKNILRIGADRKTKADKEAADTTTGGGSGRTPEGGPSVLDLSKEDFEKRQEKVRRGQ